MLLLCLRLSTDKVTRPKTSPTRIDSTGNPGIPPPVIVDVAVVISVVVAMEVAVLTVEAVSRLVDVVTVETTLDVAVTVAIPPNGANRRIVDSAPPDEIVRNLGLDPTTQPLLGESM